MNLKNIRTQQNLTQKQLAEKMDTTQQTVARWETGKTALSSAHIKQLCSVLHCAPQDLMGWEIEGEGFDGAMLLEHGFPYGTLRLTMSVGVQEHPIGDIDRDAVNAFLERRNVLNYKKDAPEWLVVTTLRKRLLLVNPASLRGVGIVSDDIEAMPELENVEDTPLSWDRDHDGLEGSGEDLHVTFIDGTTENYALSEEVANDVYSILIGNDVGEGCFLTVQDDEAGGLRTFINMGQVAMLDLPAELFASLTSDEGADNHDNG
jgi:transcriptional regulator with XRE-family HTH domain